MLFFALVVTRRLRGEIQVDSSFSGGSGEVVQLDQGSRFVSLRPTPRPGRGWECWWHVRLSGLTPGESVTVEVGPEPWATPNQASISDNGRDWRLSTMGRRVGKRIRYTIEARSSTLEVAWGPPFTVEDAQTVVRETAAKSDAQSFVLARTRGDRQTPALYFPARRETSQADRRAVWLQARQHAWEAGSSWVAQGIIDWLLDDGPECRRLRESTDIYLVPIMDIDSVAIGAGGKNQTPQDHNRDWSEQPHWPSVRAAQKRILELDRRQSLALFIDLHNPGASTRRPFFYVPPAAQLTLARQRLQQQFLGQVARSMTGPLPFTGQTQASGPGYDANWQRISKNWVARHAQDDLVTVTLETPWNTPHSTTDGYRKVGRQLAAAIAAHLADVASE